MSTSSAPSPQEVNLTGKLTLLFSRGMDDMWAGAKLIDHVDRMRSISQVDKNRLVNGRFCQLLVLNFRRPPDQLKIKLPHPAATHK